MTSIEEVELLAIRQDVYTMYVFKILNTGKYIMCTRLPNWNTPEINVGDIGFLEFEIVKAGDKYIDSSTLEEKTYSYSNVYFINFVSKSEVVSKNYVII